MGTVTVQIYRRGTKNDRYPGLRMDSSPLQVFSHATSTTVTVAGSRVAAAPVPNTRRDYWASIMHDEACYVSVGVDPTAGVPPALSWLTQPNVALEVPCKAGDLFSFKEVA